MRYRAAVIGCGRIGFEFDKSPKAKFISTHIGAYYSLKNTELVAVCDLSQKKIKNSLKRWVVPRGYTDFKKMLEKEKIDILSICTPADTHYLITRYAAQFPLRAIYCEKPISDSLRDAQKMVKLCQERKILLMINHQRRFSSFYQELKEKILDGFIGRVQQVNCYYTRGILNTGTHILDLFSFFFGQPEWLIAFYSQNKSPFKSDPNLDGIIKFRNGPLITLKACADSYYLIWELDILGTKARIRIGREFEYFRVIPGKNLLKKNELVKVKNPPFKSKCGPISLVSGLRHILNCLEKKEKPLSSGQDGMKALEIIKAMQLSARTNRKIFFD